MARWRGTKTRGSSSESDRPAPIVQAASSAMGEPLSASSSSASAAVSSRTVIEPPLVPRPSVASSMPAPEPIERSASMLFE